MAINHGESISNWISGGFPREMEIPLEALLVELKKFWHEQPRQFIRALEQGMRCWTDRVTVVEVLYPTADFIDDFAFDRILLSISENEDLCRADSITLIAMLAERNLDEAVAEYIASFNEYLCEVACGDDLGILWELLRIRRILVTNLALDIELSEDSIAAIKSVVNQIEGLSALASADVGTPDEIQHLIMSRRRPYGYRLALMFLLATDRTQIVSSILEDIYFGCQRIMEYGIRYEAVGGIVFRGEAVGFLTRALARERTSRWCLRRLDVQRLLEGAFFSDVSADSSVAEELMEWWQLRNEKLQPSVSAVLHRHRLAHECSEACVDFECPIWVTHPTSGDVIRMARRFP